MNPRPTKTSPAVVIPLRPPVDRPTPTEQSRPYNGGVGHLQHWGELLRDAVSDNTYGPSQRTDWMSAAQQFLQAIAHP
jgi:hypothetical protein